MYLGMQLSSSVISCECQFTDSLDGIDFDEVGISKQAQRSDGKDRMEYINHVSRSVCYTSLLSVLVISQYKEGCLRSDTSLPGNVV